MFVYLAITKLSVKLPIKVFFTATSILMAVMCVAFLGSGIKELAEGNVFDLTLRVPGIPENDTIQIFGIYPWLETLVPQLILSIILLVTFMIAHFRGKMDALKAEYARKEEAAAKNMAASAKNNAAPAKKKSAPGKKRDASGKNNAASGK